MLFLLLEMQLEISKCYRLPTLQASSVSVYLCSSQMFIQCWHCPHVCLWKAPPNIHQWPKDHLQHLQLVKSQELQHVGRIMHESTTCLHVNFKLLVGLLGTEWMYCNSDRSVVQFGHPFLLSLHLPKQGSQAFKDTLWRKL